MIHLGKDKLIDEINEKAFDYLLKTADTIEMDMTSEGMGNVYTFKGGWQIILLTSDNTVMGNGDGDYNTYIDYNMMKEE